jgi:hypothetical protein
MRKIILLLGAIMVMMFLTAPVMAVLEDPVSESCDFDVFISEMDVFNIECYINPVILNCEDDYVPFYNIGYISYDVCTNGLWNLTGYWVNSDGDDGSNPIPSDWLFMYFVHWQGYSYFGQLGEEDDPDIIDSGDCDDFHNRRVYFAMLGPDLCDPPGVYSCTFWFILGPA